MSSISKIIELNNIFSDVKYEEYFSNPNATTSELKKYLENFLRPENTQKSNLDVVKILDNLINSPGFIKNMDYREYINNSNTNGIENLKLKYIEDWKNLTKINLIKILISFGYISCTNYLLELVGNQSKKTYLNGNIINHETISRQRLLNIDSNNNYVQYFTKLEQIVTKISHKGIPKENINTITREISYLIHANVACTSINKSLEEHKNDINNIIYTREQEDKIFDLFYKVHYNELVNDSKNSPLKFLLYNGWEKTKIKYYWLTQLITFINNNNSECREYLILNYQLPYFEETNYKTKCWLIKEIIKKLDLQVIQSNTIINFIFDIGNYYKHSTYNKWYKKELSRINMFEKYKDKTFEENIFELVNQIPLERSTNEISELLELVFNYHTVLKSFFY